MSTFTFKNKQLNFTPISNVFIEKYMTEVCGNFVKVYLYMLKLNHCNEPFVALNILSKKLNINESDVSNALNYFKEKGVINLIPIDNNGNFEVEFNNLTKNNADKYKSFNDSIRSSNNKNLLKDIENMIGRPLSSNEMINYLNWSKEFNFSENLILEIIKYCVTRNKTDYRYIEKVALAWHEKNIKTCEDAKDYLKQFEDKWIKINSILNFLGKKNNDIPKIQIEMIEKWLYTYNFSVEIIEKACTICIQRLGSSNFKYIDSILSGWNKKNLKTLIDIENSENSFNKNGFINSKSINTQKQLKFNNFEQREYDYDKLEEELQWRNYD